MQELPSPPHFPLEKNPLWRAIGRADASVIPSPTGLWNVRVGPAKWWSLPFGGGRSLGAVIKRYHSAFRGGHSRPSLQQAAKNTRAREAEWSLSLSSSTAGLSSSSSSCGHSTTVVLFGEKGLVGLTNSAPFSCAMSSTRANLSSVFFSPASHATATFYRINNRSGKCFPPR